LIGSLDQLLLQSIKHNVFAISIPRGTARETSLRQLRQVRQKRNLCPRSNARSSEHGACWKKGRSGQLHNPIGSNGKMTMLFFLPAREIEYLAAPA
jgi:hypothetical protein